MYSKMESKHFFVVLGLLALGLIVAIEAVEEKKIASDGVGLPLQPKNTTTKIEKQLVAKKKLPKAKTPEVSTKLRVTRSVDKLSSTPSSPNHRQAIEGDLMTAANEKKYMLVKKKPKHKKIKMEVFKPKMKYKKIKMKIPVKKMKKKKVKGYLVKKEHHHHEY